MHRRTSTRGCGGGQQTSFRCSTEPDRRTKKRRGRPPVEGPSRHMASLASQMYSHLCMVRVCPLVLALTQERVQTSFTFLPGPIPGEPLPIPPGTQSWPAFMRVMKSAISCQPRSDLRLYVETKNVASGPVKVTIIPFELLA